LNPGDSLFGTYFTSASLDEGTLDLTSIFLVTGGTGLFANDFGAIFGLGSLNDDTGSFDETFTGQLDTIAPEPGTSGLIAITFPALWLLSRAVRKRGSERDHRSNV
jgi:hypothetical protein